MRSQKRSEWLVIALLVMAAIIPAVAAESYSVTLQPNATQGKDCWLQDGFPNLNYGIDNLLEIRGNDNRRILIEFNISSIPPNAIIESAYLNLYLLNKGSVSSINASLQRIIHEWTEGTGNGDRTEDGATWNTYNGTNNWNIEGGDFDSYIWTITEISSTNTLYSFDIKELVQSWINNTYENYGFIIRNMRVSSGEWKFASSDNTNSSISPKINITYTIPDITPPSSISNLINQSQGIDYIYWTWTNPLDADFAESIVHLDGVNVVNTSDSYYNATGLNEDTEYTITVHTKDINGNVNNSDVSNTAQTSISCAEDWTAHYTTCNISDQNVTYYIDENSCGTYALLPLDNGTVNPCDYCTPDWIPSNTSCISNQLTQYYLDANYAVCCAVTALESDCHASNGSYSNQTFACGTAETPASTISGGGGGGSSITFPAAASYREETCTESWICESWSGCVNGMKTRTCDDLSSCGTIKNKPEETAPCIAEEGVLKTMIIEEEPLGEISGNAVKLTPEEEPSLLFGGITSFITKNAEAVKTGAVNFYEAIAYDTNNLVVVSIAIIITILSIIFLNKGYFGHYIIYR